MTREYYRYRYAMKGFASSPYLQNCSARFIRNIVWAEGLTYMLSPGQPSHKRIIIPSSSCPERTWTTFSSSCADRSLGAWQQQLMFFTVLLVIEEYNFPEKPSKTECMAAPHLAQVHRRDVGLDPRRGIRHNGTSGQ